MKPTLGENETPSSEGCKPGRCRPPAATLCVVTDCLAMANVATIFTGCTHTHRHTRKIYHPQYVHTRVHACVFKKKNIMVLFRLCDASLFQQRLQSIASDRITMTHLHTKTKMRSFPFTCRFCCANFAIKMKKW